MWKLEFGPEGFALIVPSRLWGKEKPEGVVGSFAEHLAPVIDYSDRILHLQKSLPFKSFTLYSFLFSPSVTAIS